MHKNIFHINNNRHSVTDDVHIFSVGLNKGSEQRLYDNRQIHASALDLVYSHLGAVFQADNPN